MLESSASSSCNLTFNICRPVSFPQWLMLYYRWNKSKTAASQRYLISGDIFLASPDTHCYQFRSTDLSAPFYNKCNFMALTTSPTYMARYFNFCDYSQMILACTMFMTLHVAKWARGSRDRIFSRFAIPRLSWRIRGRRFSQTQCSKCMQTNEMLALFVRTEPV